MHTGTCANTSRRHTQEGHASTAWKDSNNLTRTLSCDLIIRSWEGFFPQVFHEPAGQA